MKIKFIITLLFTFIIFTVSGKGNKHNPSIVFIGNSITEEWNRLDPDYFKKNKFIAKGISGQTTTQFLERFEKDVLSLQPDIVIIEGGANDIAENDMSYEEERTFNNIVKMAELAEANNIKVVISSLLPAAKFHWRESVKHVPKKIKRLNERLKTYSASKGYFFIDYYPVMTSDGISLKSNLTRDGVHPNLEGFKIMEAVFSYYYPFIR